MAFVRGIDVGGTSIKAVLGTDTGEIIKEWSAPTPHGGPAVVAAVAELVQQIDAAAAELIDTSELLNRICVCVPGILDVQTGEAVLSVNLGWEHFMMRDELTKALGMPVFVLQDVRSGAYGEMAFGAAPRTCIYVAIGTGIAAATLIDGELLSPDLWTGEVGQAPLPNPDKPGETAPLEQISSAAAFARRIIALDPQLLPKDAGAYEAFRLADTGNEIARRVVDTGLATLADAIVQWTALIGPIPVVIGGGLGKEGQSLIDTMTALINERAPYAPAPVVTASLGSKSQALGTIAYARDHEF